MKTKVFTILDSKASVYGVPFFLQNEAVAVRMFTDLTNDPKSQIAQHPEDYTLYEIGAYEDANALLIPNDKPRPVILASSLVRLPNPDANSNLDQLKMFEKNTQKKLDLNGSKTDFGAGRTTEGKFIPGGKS